MSSRYISIEEITSILAAIEDQQGIELLKKIRDNLNKADEEKDRKEEQKFNDDKAGLSPEDLQKQSDRISERRAFVGFAKEEDLGVKDPDNKDADKVGILRRLEETGLILKGGYIPLNKQRINSYKLTNEGYALLYLVEKIKGGGSQKQREEPRSSSSSSSSSSKDNTIKANESVRISKN